ncbi:MAG: glycosyltransferase, partial [Halobacteriaceae archaeon]
YDSFNEWISGYQPEQIRNQTLIANSQWMAGIIQARYDTEPLVVYPPVETGDFPNQPWNKRESGFVTIGRVSQDKNTIKSIKIVQELRKQEKEVHLHIIGPVSNSEYGDTIRQISSSHDWINLEGKVSRSELTEIVSSHKYGLHTKFDEHFGIAVAELVAGGTIPFVPDSGGAKEIINQHPKLTFNSSTECVDRATDIISNDECQEEIRKELPNISENFGRERFKNEISNIIKDTINS